MMATIEQRLARAKGFFPEGIAFGPGPTNEVARIYVLEDSGHPGRTGIGYIDLGSSSLHLDIGKAPKKHQAQLLAIAASYEGKATTTL